MATIARANIGTGTQPLLSPYVPSDSALIRPSEDFTVRITTISKSVLDEYRDKMKAGQFGNNYFCLLSHFGIGSNGGNTMPSRSINLVELIDNVNDNILDLWGRNIRWIRDYKDKGADGESGSIYIGTSAFCQGIGPSPLQQIYDAFTQVSSVVGRFDPALVPYTTAANLALKGIIQIVNKLTDNPDEVVNARITLFPSTLGHPLPPGDAYLQRGSYVFFFENTSLENLHITDTGEVVASQGTNAIIPPYVVINIVDGIDAAPSSEALNRAVANDILNKYDKRFSLPTDLNSSSTFSSFAEGLQKIGDSYYFLSQIKRFEELRKKTNKTDTEIDRMNTIKSEIESMFPSLKIG